MLKRALSVLFVLFVPVVLPAVVRGQVRVGPEYQVNAYIGGNQRAASVATDTAGNFVVVWQGRDGNGYGVFARWHDTSGIPLGSAEFQVNTYTPGSQTVPSVAATPGGQVVVVWQSDEQDGSLEGIFARQYDAAGTPLGPEFPVNTYTTSGQSRPSVASDESGNFVVVWQSYGQDGSLDGIFARQYDAEGAPRGPEFPVNIHTTFGQSRPSVASDASGNFVVVWQSLQDGDHQGDVFAQRFDSTGARVGGEFMVNNYTTSAQTEPAVTSDALGNFVVAWASRQDASASYDVFAQRYDAAGTTMGGEFGVNAYTADDQRFPKVAIAPNGFVVVWESNGQDGSLGGSFGRRYDTRGTPEGPEFQLNTYTTDDQLSAAVASDGSGRFLTVWNSRGQDGSGNGIFGQRFLPDVIFRDGFEDGTLAFKLATAGLRGVVDDTAGSTSRTTSLTTNTVTARASISIQTGYFGLAIDGN